MTRVLAWARRHADALAVVAIIAALQAASLYSSAQTRATQQHQAQVFERKLCTTLGSLAALKPPAGSPQANPSRAYLQAEHARLAQLGPDVGCPQGGTP